MVHVPYGLTKSEDQLVPPPQRVAACQFLLDYEHLYEFSSNSSELLEETKNVLEQTQKQIIKKLNSKLKNYLLGFQLISNNKYKLIGYVETFRKINIPKDNYFNVTINQKENAAIYSSSKGKSKIEERILTIFNLEMGFKISNFETKKMKFHKIYSKEILEFIMKKTKYNKNDFIEVIHYVRDSWKEIVETIINTDFHYEKVDFLTQ